jgi:hypothetical protein
LGWKRTSLRPKRVTRNRLWGFNTLVARHNLVDARDGDLEHCREVPFVEKLLGRCQQGMRRNESKKSASVKSLGFSIGYRVKLNFPSHK